MLTIDSLSLRLPPGFEARAEPIARLVADAFATLEPSAPAALEHLALDPIAIERDASDRDIAARIAAALARELRRGGAR